MSIRRLNRGIVVEFTVFDFVLWFGIFVAMMSYQAKERRTILFLGIVVILSYVLYSYGTGAMAGMITAVIALAALIFQAAIPDRYLEKTFFIRNAAALLCIFAALSYIYNEPADIYPLIGFIFARFAEAQACSQRIRLAYIGSYAAWALYAAELGLMSLYITQCFAVFSLLYAIWNFEQKRKKAVPAPAYAT